MSASDSPLPGLGDYIPPEKGGTAKSGKKKRIYWESVGAVKVPIHQFTTRGQERYCITYRPAKKAKRIRVTRVNLAEAKKEANKICMQIARGQISAGRLTADELLQAATALEILRPLGLTLDGAARDVQAALKSAGGTATLAELGRFWSRHHGAATSRKTAAEVHRELLESKAPLGLSAQYNRQLKRDLGRFVAAFTDRTLAEISVADVRKYLFDRQVGWKRFNNLRSLIITLFLFAKNQGYLAQDRDTAPERVEPLGKPRNAPPPRVFTPAELRAAFEHVQRAWLPWLALGAFAGLRTAEIGRLEWEDVLWEDKLIHITAKVAKRTSRKVGDVRYVPMSANLLAWLRPWRGKKGRVAPRERSDAEAGRIGKLLPDGKWGKNPLRHSWISYRSAETSNLPLVADEAGNSTEISRTAYRNPRMKREAVEWFNIFPPDEPQANVVQMTAAAAR